jgi:NAD(P)-dependent dehydrogenase (short-subunit alcohol dehydrogenase family)
VFLSLKERVAIITGAGQGFGRVFAEAFAQVGAALFLASDASGFVTGQRINLDGSATES